MSQENAESAEAVTHLAEEALASTEAGGKAMERMIQTIDSIKAASDKTAKIIKTIDEIAFQTNLLALNAAVEAARAGDSGRGFAVVAEEVRNLAGRSAEAAKTTNLLIEDSQKQAAQGVAVSSEVRQLLSQVQERVDKVNSLIKRVAQASFDQTRGVAEINADVSDMQAGIQENSASAEETAAASEELSAQADLLAAVVQELGRLTWGSSHLRNGPTPL